MGDLIKKRLPCGSIRLLAFRVVNTVNIVSTYNFIRQVFGAAGTIGSIVIGSSKRNDCGILQIESLHS